MLCGRQYSEPSKECNGNWELNAGRAVSVLLRASSIEHRAIFHGSELDSELQRARNVAVEVVV